MELGAWMAPHKHLPRHAAAAGAWGKPALMLGLSGRQSKRTRPAAFSARTHRLKVLLPAGRRCPAPVTMPTGLSVA